MTVNETETNAPPPSEAPAAPTPSEEERIRKIYVKDLKQGESIHTVFKCLKKERHATRSGKPYLAVVLCDRTGDVDARVFENVDAAELLFAIGDYLLLQGKVGAFHGKTQVVIDRLERLDPEPIDAAEFAWTAPPKPVEPEPSDKARAPKEPRALASSPEPMGEEISHKAARQRLLRLLDNPQLVLALDAVVRHLEAYLDERIAVKLGLPVPAAPARTEREKRPRGPRVEHRPPVEATSKPEKHEPRRDPTLPEGLSFKPLDALVGENSAPKPGQG